MSKTVIIMGKSSSGKDTIFRELLKLSKLKKIVPYTTRPIRTGEINGVDYFFVTDEYLEKNKERIIESRTYDTVYGKWTYGELNDSQLSENTDCILVATPEAYKAFVNYFGLEKIVPIYIYLDEGERLQRALNRERSQVEPKYAEMCRRFLSDEADFSEEKLKEVPMENRFENIILEDVVKEILETLSQNGVNI